MWMDGVDRGVVGLNMGESCGASAFDLVIYFMRS